MVNKCIRLLSTNSPYLEKALACENWGFVHKKEGALFDTHLP